MYRVDAINGETVAILHENNHYSMRRLASCTFTEGVNNVGSCDFALYKMHPEFDNLAEMTTIIRIVNTQTNDVEFEGRIAKITDCGMDSSGVIAKKCHCEGLMAYLYDTVQMYQTYESQTPTQFLNAIVAAHNAQVSSDKQISSVYCEVIGNTNSKTTAYRSTMDEIKENLISRLGGEIALRRNASNQLVLYYFNDGGDGSVKATKVELARNMVALKQDVDATGIITRLIPLGAQLSNDSAERLTLSTDTYPTKWIDDTTAMAKYGVIVGTVEFDDITVESNLLAAGQAALSQNNAVKYSYQAEVLDLSTIGDDEFAFRSGDSYEFVNSMMGFDETLRLQTRTVDIYEPYKPKVTIGEKVKTITSAISKAQHFVNVQLPTYKSDILAAAKANALSLLLDETQNGNVVFEYSQDGASIVAINVCNAATVDASTKRWRWSQGGFGYMHRTSTTDSWQGPDVAMTINGEVVADMIKTGILNSIAIQSGDDGQGNYTFSVDTAGNVVANSLSSNNATITGGKITINASTQNYDYISLNYTNQSDATWHSEMTPLQIELSNTDTGYVYTAQSAGTYFRNSNGYYSVILGTDGLRVKDENTGDDILKAIRSTVNNITVGKVEIWNGSEWVNLWDVSALKAAVLSGSGSITASRVQADDLVYQANNGNYYNLKTLHDAVFPP